MSKNLIRKSKKIVLSAMALSLAVAGFPAAASADAISDALCATYVIIGVPCTQQSIFAAGTGSYTGSSNYNSTGNTGLGNQLVGGDTTQNQTANISGGLNQTANLSANVSGAVKRNVSRDKVVLVKVPAVDGLNPTLGLNENVAIYEIIKGQRHFIPTADIFASYGFDFKSVQDISRADLEKFPRTKIVQVDGNKKKKYYITETGYIRLLPSDEVFESYGNRKEDLVVISETEFSFYPRNQFVYLEGTVDVFQISEEGVKRYVVPQMLNKWKITFDQIAPINKAEFEAYKYGTPILF